MNNRSLSALFRLMLIILVVSGYVLYNDGVVAALGAYLVTSVVGFGAMYICYRFWPRKKD